MSAASAVTTRVTGVRWLTRKLPSEPSEEASTTVPACCDTTSPLTSPDGVRGCGAPVVGVVTESPQPAQSTASAAGQTRRWPLSMSEEIATPVPPRA